MDKIFLQFLELHSTLSEKKNFITNFPFLTHSLNQACPPTPEPHPLNSQNLLSVTKVFCQCSLTRYSYQFFYFLLFTSSVVDPYHFLQLFSRELHSKVPEKNIFVASFPFLMDSPKLLHHMTKVFLLVLPFQKKSMQHCLVCVQCQLEMACFGRRISHKTENHLQLSQNLWYFDKVKSSWKLTISFC